jgi:hypothetical protein
MGEQIATHTHYAKDILLHPTAQGTTFGSAAWGVFGFTLQELAAVVAIIFGCLQIYLAIERRWFRKGSNRRKGDEG